MRKLIIGALAAFLLGTAVFAQPAEARCFWNGFATVCNGPPGWARHHYWGPHHWRHYEPY
jgi:hypothetical protein